MSVVPENDDGASRNDEDEIPRRGFLSTIPKRTFSRVLLLLAALAGILYLRQRTGSIASCMAGAFNLPPPVKQTKTSAPMKARVVLPSEPARDPR